jgi:transcriptional regulator with XRE-family HTH domain
VIAEVLTLDIAEKINNLLAERGITRYKLAKEAKVPYTTLVKILDGTTKNPQIDSIKLLADYLGEPIGYFTEEDHENASPTWATSKDKRDLKKFIDNPAGLYYNGIEFSDEDKAKMLGVLETIFWEAKKKNKEVHKKSREKDTKKNN